MLLHEIKQPYCHFFRIAAMIKIVNVSKEESKISNVEKKTQKDILIQ